MELELYVIYQDEQIVKHSFKKIVLIKLAIFELNFISTNTYHILCGWNGVEVYWQELRCLRSQNRTNTNQFSEEIGWKEMLNGVDYSKRRRYSVSDKKISNGEVEETCTIKGEALKERKDEYFLDRTNCTA